MEKLIEYEIENQQIYVNDTIAQKLQELFNNSNYKVQSATPKNITILVEQETVIKINHKDGNVTNFSFQNLKTRRLKNYDSDTINLSTYTIRSEISYIIDQIYLGKIGKYDKSVIDYIFCTSGKCPICNSELEQNTQNLMNDMIQMECKNNCYKIMRPMKKFRLKGHFYIFDEIYNTFDTDKLNEKIKTLKNLNQKIEYWKENDRYVGEILKK